MASALSEIKSCPDSPLHQAILSRDLDSVEELLTLPETNVNAVLPEKRDSDGCSWYTILKDVTPLHLAAYKGFAEAVEALMLAGANADAQFLHTRGTREDSGPRAGRESTHSCKYKAEEVAHRTVKNLFVARKKILTITVRALKDDCVYVSYMGLDGSSAEVDVKPSAPSTSLLDVISEKVGSKSLTLMHNDKILDLRPDMTVLDAFPEIMIQQMFKKADGNSDGALSKEELKALLTHIDVGKQLDDQRFEEIFKQVDLNADGKLQFEEFVSWCYKTDAKGASS